MTLDLIRPRRVRVLIFISGFYFRRRRRRCRRRFGRRARAKKQKGKGRAIKTSFFPPRHPGTGHAYIDALACIRRKCISTANTNTRRKTPEIYVSPRRYPATGGGETPRARGTWNGRGPLERSKIPAGKTLTETAGACGHVASPPSRHRGQPARTRTRSACRCTRRVIERHDRVRLVRRARVVGPE